MTAPQQQKEAKSSMASFGKTPTSPQGNHKRKEKIIVAGAVHKEKQVSPIVKAVTSLNVRERIMISALAIVAIVAVVVFLVVLPALDKVTTLEDEVAVLQGAQSEAQQVLDQIPGYRTAVEEAEKDYKNYQHFYYEFMDPEAIDKTVTNMLLNNDLDPQRLTMTSINHEELPAYVPFTLVPKPVPVPTKPEDADESTGADSAEGSENGGGSESSSGSNMPSGPQAAEAEAAGEAALAPENPTGLVAGTLIYCYTIDIEARGWMEDLFSFLAEARGITAMEVVTYSYVEAPEATPIYDEDGDLVWQAPVSGTILMQLKLYVFVDGGVTTPNE
jgi:type II secretory pathway pseudopilin PulG